MFLETSSVTVQVFHSVTYSRSKIQAGLICGNSSKVQDAISRLLELLSDAVASYVHGGIDSTCLLFFSLVAFCLSANIRVH